MDLRAIEELRALEARDRELTEQAARLRAQQTEVALVRARAEEIDAFFVSYPAAEARVRAAAAAAEADLAARRAEAAERQTQLERARDDDARAAAQRAVARALDHVEVAERRVARALEERDELERAAAALPDELPTLAARVGAPADGPRELVDWTARAQASLFVAAGQLDLQRERVIREANELATMLLGEPTYGATPAQARARVEAALR